MRRRFINNIRQYEYSKYMTVEALDDGVVLYFSRDVEYSYNGGNWEYLLSEKYTPNLNNGDLISFRCRLIPGESFGYMRGNGGAINLRGNVMSLIFGDKEVGSLDGYYYVFDSTFFGNNIINIDKGFLPATTLAEYCYYRMFEGCDNLITTPELPATTLENYCYESMFSDCTSLTTAPALPATTLENYCYESMFSGCTSLVNAPELPATTLENYCYQRMFSGCTSLTTAPVLPATTLAAHCYDSMFYNCTSLVTVPELPATILADNCYSFMFYGCTSLTQAPELPATTLASNCYQRMFSGCTSLVNAPELPATTLENYCYDSMFENCSSLTTAPTLPATTLAKHCYSYMFDDCTSLNYIKMLATDISANSCLYSWVRNVSSTGTFVKNPDATWDVVGVSGVPSGWTVKFDGEEEEQLINFYIYHPYLGTNELYQAEKGMTWQQWVNSSYNQNGFFFLESEFIYNDDGLVVVISITDSTYVKSNEVIIENHTYSYD